MKEPITQCVIKKGKPYNGIVISYYESDKTFGYKKYKDGKREKRQKHLSKKELLKLLKQYKKDS